MSIPAVVPVETLPGLVDRARHILAEARTSAEVLEGLNGAAFAYDAAKAAARFAKAKNAHDDLIAAAHRAQADAAEIEALAKRRLAEEYDAAQERGEVQIAGGDRKSINVGASDNDRPTVVDLGLTRQQVHEARQIRDAEAIAPGVVRRTLDERLARGQEPTKAAVREAVSTVLQLGDRVKQVPSFEDLEREIEAETAADEARDLPDIDFESVEGRAHKINGSVSTIAMTDITGREYMAVFNRDPARRVYAGWIRDAHAKLSNILKEIDDAGIK